MQKKRKYTGKRVVYFGNKYLGKDSAYDATSGLFESKWVAMGRNIK